jgi:hypothetical protein
MLPVRPSMIDLIGFVVNGDEMSVVVYLLVTVAIFAILGTMVKLVERL